MPSIVKVLRHISTDEKSVKAASRVVDPVAAIPGPKGPMVGETKFSDKDFVSMHATAADLAQLRAAIEARAARAVPIKPVLLVCDNRGCRKWMMGNPEWVGSPCVVCGMIRGREGEGGKMRLATSEEIRLYEENEAAARARGERIQFEDEQTNRRKIGKVPFKDIAEWKAARVADFQERLRHEAKVAAAWDAQKKGKI